MSENSCDDCKCPVGIGDSYCATCIDKPDTEQERYYKHWDDNDFWNILDRKGSQTFQTVFYFEAEIDLVINAMNAKPIAEPVNAELIDELEKAFAESMMWNGMKRRAVAESFAKSFSALSASTVEQIGEDGYAVSDFVSKAQYNKIYGHLIGAGKRARRLKDSEPAVEPNELVDEWREQANLGVLNEFYISALLMCADELEKSTQSRPIATGDRGAMYCNKHGGYGFSSDCSDCTSHSETLNDT